MNVFRLAGAALALVLSTQALAVGRMADVNVFDRSNGRRLPVYWHAGQAYVVGKPGSEYRVEVRNREGGDLLAVVSVDGVNVITGESAHPAQSGYVVGPRGRLAVDGWRKSLERTAAFYFTALGDSYAARTGRPEDVGCQSVRDPIMRSLLAGDRAAARGQVTRLLDLIETMPVPTEPAHR